MKKYILVDIDSEVYSSDSLESLIRILIDKGCDNSFRLFIHVDGFYCDVTDVFSVCYTFVKHHLYKEGS